MGRSACTSSGSIWRKIMNEIVKRYIEKKQKEIEQKNAKDKAKKLVELDLFKKSMKVKKVITLKMVVM